jgi:hypothetical protein
VETASFILLGAFLGTVGGILHLLTVHERTWLQVAINLMVGCTVGTIAGIALLGTEASGVLLVAIIALGYAGTDFILALLGR